MTGAAPEPLAVGLAGAGPWAGLVTAPVLAAGPETRLAAVWSRTPASATRLADAHGAPAVGSFDALLDVCDAVALAVPPTVQPDLAITAAGRGKALLLEKPVGVDTASAERVASAVRDAGVGSLVAFTYRYRPAARDFVESARSARWLGGRGCFLSGAFLGGPFEGGWRAEHGCVLDVGPHLLDLLDVALGPIRAVRATGDPHAWVSVLAEHEGGPTSEAALCCTTAGPSRTEVEVFGRDGRLALDGRADDPATGFAAMRADLARVARTGAPHPCDVFRGVEVQRIVDAVGRALTTGDRVELL